MGLEPAINMTSVRLWSILPCVYVGGFWSEVGTKWDRWTAAERAECLWVVVGGWVMDICICCCCRWTRWKGDDDLGNREVDIVSTELAWRSRLPW